MRALVDSLDDPSAVLFELMRRDFGCFLERAFAWVNGGKSMVWNWHFDAIANRLEQIAVGTNQYLLVTLPPRSGKSIAMSIAWVAWMLGQDPTRNFVCVSYSNELSAKLARDCLAVMQSAWYRELFPRTVISPRRSAAYDFETTAGGGRLATSVTGTLTGRGGDIIILDDVIKPEEANSETTRTFVNAWYQSTLASRLNDKSTGAIICVMQRLHQNDLAGVLLEAGGWDHLKLPAIAAEDLEIPLTRGRMHHFLEGELLHPAREPLAVLEQLLRSMGSGPFAAQYLQDPVPAVGNMIRAEWLRNFDPAMLVRTRGQIVQSWDTAGKDNPHSDYSACVTALVQDRKVYILDVYRARLEFPRLREHTVRLAREHGASALLIEDQSSGTQLIQTLRAENLVGVPWPVPRKPESDKVSRVAGISSMIEAGQLLLPGEAEWLAGFMSELLGFPNARFDDQVDALSQLLIWVRGRDQWDSDDMVYGPVLGIDLLKR